MLPSASEALGFGKASSRDSQGKNPLWVFENQREKQKPMVKAHGGKLQHPPFFRDAFAESKASPGGKNAGGTHSSGHPIPEANHPCGMWGHGTISAPQLPACISMSTSKHASPQFFAKHLIIAVQLLFTIWGGLPSAAAARAAGEWAAGAGEVHGTRWPPELVKRLKAAR